MKRPKSNRELKLVYNRIFSRGEKTHFTKFLEQKGRLPSDEREVLQETSWKGKRVLDVGCGTGLFAHEAAKRGATVLAIDYAPQAIAEAQRVYRHRNLTFARMDVSRVRGTFDIVVSLGTLEHLDNPYAVLAKLKKRLAMHGSLILTCPNWTNPRGYMLIVLLKLFDAPITLADLHHFSPQTFTQWARRLGMRLTWRTFDASRAYGPNLIADFRKRLPNVLRDARLPQLSDGVPSLLAWITEHVLPITDHTASEGASILCHFRRTQQKNKTRARASLKLKNVKSRN